MSREWTNFYTKEELDAEEIPTVSELLEQTVSEYTNLEQSGEDEPTVIGGGETNAEGIITALLADPRYEIANEDEMRDIYLGLITGDGDEDQLFADEYLEELGVEEDQYDEFRRDMIQVFERGLRGEILGPGEARGNIRDDYNVEKFGPSFFSLKFVHGELKRPRQ